MSSVFISFLALIRQTHLHVVHIYVIRRAVAVQVDLESISQLRTIAREQRVMHDVRRIGDAVYRQGIMEDLRALRVIHRDDVMPGIGSEGLKSNGCALPMFGREVKYAPSLASIVSLPGIVVGITVGILLAFKFDSLRS